MKIFDKIIDSIFIVSLLFIYLLGLYFIFVGDTYLGLLVLIFAVLFELLNKKQSVTIKLIME